MYCDYKCREIATLRVRVDGLEQENTKLRSESTCHGDECRIREIDALRAKVERYKTALVHYRDSCKRCRGRGEYAYGPGMWTPCEYCRPARNALKGGKE
jgi:hypothetical protein